jgi:hypothetical protein
MLVHKDEQNVFLCSFNKNKMIKNVIFFLENVFALFRITQ